MSFLRHDITDVTPLRFTPLIFFFTLLTPDIFAADFTIIFSLIRHFSRSALSHVFAFHHSPALRGFVHATKDFFLLRSQRHAAFVIAVFSCRATQRSASQAMPEKRAGAFCPRFAYFSVFRKASIEIIDIDIFDIADISSPAFSISQSYR
jgi:hypothetical protein